MLDLGKAFNQVATDLVTECLKTDATYGKLSTIVSRYIPTPIAGNLAAPQVGTLIENLYREASDLMFNGQTKADIEKGILKANELYGILSEIRGALPEEKSKSLPEWLLESALLIREPFSISNLRAIHESLLSGREHIPSDSVEEELLRHERIVAMCRYNLYGIISTPESDISSLDIVKTIQSVLTVVDSCGRDANYSKLWKIKTEVYDLGYEALNKAVKAVKKWPDSEDKSEAQRILALAQLEQAFAEAIHVTQPSAASLQKVIESAIKISDEFLEMREERGFRAGRSLWMALKNLHDIVPERTNQLLTGILEPEKIARQIDARNQALANDGTNLMYLILPGIPESMLMIARTIPHGIEFRQRLIDFAEKLIEIGNAAISKGNIPTDGRVGKYLNEIANLLEEVQTTEAPRTNKERLRQIERIMHNEKQLGDKHIIFNTQDWGLIRKYVPDSTQVVFTLLKHNEQLLYGNNYAEYQLSLSPLDTKNSDTQFQMSISGRVLGSCSYAVGANCKQEFGDMESIPPSHVDMLLDLMELAQKMEMVK